MRTKKAYCFYQNHGEALTITKGKKENEETEDKNQKR